MSLQLITDKQLIRSYLSGCHSSFEVLLNRHKKRVYSYINMLVKDKHLSEDLFQDTFIKVINNLRSGKYKEKGKFLPWVLRIAHNLIMDHFRVSKHIPYFHNKGDHDFSEFIHMLEHTIEDKIVIDQIHKNVKALLNHLPPEQKEVIVMRHYYDMTFKDISEELDTSLNTILARMRYGLINLRKLIRQKHLEMSP
jgi:RNA polymerase sigma factor (sigma-70 family)